jgi:XTP/dITP diphosphohydrolase
MISLCFATNNQHKIEEIGALLGPFFQVKSLKEIGCFEELAETQPTIEGNSLQKAKYVFDTYGESCFADDTGLEVEALNGEPGVFSARYARLSRPLPIPIGAGGEVGHAGADSENNITLLLHKMKGLSNRGAQFKSVITLVLPSGVSVFEGIVKGQILHERRGTMGFGYDSVFLPDGFPKTFAEMSLYEKNIISHRAIAVKKLINFLGNTKS